MEEVIYLSSGSDDEESEARNVNDRRFSKIRQMAKTIMFSKIFLKEECEFPYAFLKELFVILKTKLSEIYSESLKSFVLYNVLQWLQAMKLNYDDLVHDEKFNFILVDFMALYINYKCKVNYKLDSYAKIEYVINEILTSLHVIFNEKSTFIIMTLLKIEIHKQFAVILYPIFKKILSDTRLYSTNDMIRYILLILSYRQWKMLVSDIEDKEDIHAIAEGKTEGTVSLEKRRVTSFAQKRVIPMKVPTVDNTNSHFTAISDLIGFAIRSGVDGTRVLLTNQTMDFPVAVEKYFKQYEYHINRYHSTQRIFIDVNRCTNGFLLGNNISKNKGLSIHQSTFANRRRDENIEVQHSKGICDTIDASNKLYDKKKRVNNIISRLKDAITRHKLNKSTKEVKDGCLEKNNGSCCDSISSGDVVNISGEVTQRFHGFESYSSSDYLQLKSKTPLKRRIIQDNEIETAVNQSIEEKISDRIPFCIQGEVSSTTYSDNQSSENNQHLSPDPRQTDIDTTEKQEEDSILSNGSTINLLTSDLKPLSLSSCRTVELVESTSSEYNTEQSKTKFEQNQNCGKEMYKNEGENQYLLTPSVFEIGQCNCKNCQNGDKFKDFSLHKNISSGPLACTEVSSSANDNNQSERNFLNILNINIQQCAAEQKSLQSKLLDLMNEKQTQIKPSGECLSKEELENIENEITKRRQSIRSNTDMEWKKLIMKCKLENNNEVDQACKANITSESNRITIENGEYTDNTLADEIHRYTQMDIEGENKLEIVQNINYEEIEANQNNLIAIDCKSRIENNRKLNVNQIDNLNNVKEQCTSQLTFSEVTQLKRTRRFSPMEMVNEDLQSETKNKSKNMECMPISQIHPKYDDYVEVKGTSYSINKDAESVTTYINEEQKRQYDNELTSTIQINNQNKIDNKTRADIYIPDIKLPYVMEVECKDSSEENSQNNTDIICITTSEEVEQQIVDQKMAVSEDFMNIGQTVPLIQSISIGLDIRNNIQKKDQCERNEIILNQRKIDTFEKHSNLLEVCAIIDSNPVQKNAIEKLSNTNLNSSEGEYKNIIAINNSHSVGKIKMTVSENYGYLSDLSCATSHNSASVGYELYENSRQHSKLESNNQRSDANHAQTPFKWRLKRKLSGCYNLNEFSNLNSSQENIIANKTDLLNSTLIEIPSIAIDKAKSAEVSEHNNQLINKLEKIVHNIDHIGRKYAEKSNAVIFSKKLDDVISCDSIEHDEKNIYNPEYVTGKYAFKDILRLDNSLGVDSIEHEDKNINLENVTRKYADNSNEDLLLRKLNGSLGGDFIEDVPRIHAKKINENIFLKNLDNTLGSNTVEHEEVKIDNSDDVPWKYAENCNENMLLKRLDNLLRDDSIEHGKNSLNATSSKISTELCFDIQDYGEKQKKWMSNLGLCRNDYKQYANNICLPEEHKRDIQKIYKKNLTSTTKANECLSSALCALRNIRSSCENPFRLSKKKFTISKGNLLKNGSKQRNKWYVPKNSTKHLCANTNKVKIGKNFQNPIQKYTLKPVAKTKQNNRNKFNNTKEIDALTIGDKLEIKTHYIQSKNSHVEGASDSLQIPLIKIEDFQKNYKAELKKERNTHAEKNIYTSTETSSNIKLTNSENILDFDKQVENINQIKSIGNNRVRKVLQKCSKNNSKIDVNARSIKTTCGVKKSTILYAKSVLPIDSEKSIKKVISKNITRPCECLKSSVCTVSLDRAKHSVKQETTNASIQDQMSKEGKKYATIKLTNNLDSKLFTEVGKSVCIDNPCQTGYEKSVPQKIFAKKEIQDKDDTVSESHLSEFEISTAESSKPFKTSDISEKQIQKYEGKIFQNRKATSSDDDKSKEAISQYEICTDIVTKSCFVKIKNTLDRLNMQDCKKSRKRDGGTTKDIKKASGPMMQVAKYISKKNWNYEKQVVHNTIKNFNLEKLEKNMELLLQALSNLPKKPSIEAYFILNKIIITVIYEFLSDCSKLTSGRIYLYLCTKTKELQAENIEDAQLLDIENKYKILKKNAENLVALKIIQYLDIFLIKFKTVKKYLFNDIWLNENKNNIQNYINTVPVESVIINKRTTLAEESINSLKERDYTNTEEMETDIPEIIKKSKINVENNISSNNYNLIEANKISIDETSCLNTRCDISSSNTKISCDSSSIYSSNSIDIGLSFSKINQSSEIAAPSDVLLSGPDADFNFPMYQRTMNKLYEMGNSNTDSMLEPCLFDSVVDNSSDSKLATVELQKHAQAESMNACDEWGLFDCLQDVVPQSDLILSTSQKSCDITSNGQSLSFEVDSDIDIKTILPSFDVLEDYHAVNLQKSVVDLSNVDKSTSNKYYEQKELKNIETVESVHVTSIPTTKHNVEVDTNFSNSLQFELREKAKIENIIPTEKNKIIRANGIHHPVRKIEFVSFNAKKPKATRHIQKSKSKLVPFPFWKKTTEKQKIDREKLHSNENKSGLMGENTIRLNKESVDKNSIQKPQDIDYLRNVSDKESNIKNEPSIICVGKEFEKELAYRDCDSSNHLQVHAMQNKFTNLAQTMESKHV